MTDKASYTEIKDGFYLVNSPEIREYPWYLMRKPGLGTFAEVVKDVEVGIFIAPWPFNKRIVVESHTDPELRKLWDESGVSEVVLFAHEAIMAQLAEEEDC
ncbi:MAG: hypothetical protein AB9873_18525 [Syntrophobacteraceae bacterium]